LNYDTIEQIEQLKKRLDKLEQDYAELKGQTEPLRILKLEIEANDIHHQLKTIIQMQANHSEDLDTLKRILKRVEADTILIKSDRGDVRHYLENYKQRLESIETKQDNHSELLAQLIDVGEEMKTTQTEHTKRFDHIDETMATKEDLSQLEKRMATKEDLSQLEKRMATKEDLSQLEGRIGRIEKTQTEQGAKLDLILQLLQPKKEK
jgi:chromosome segregation ATPase